MRGSKAKRLRRETLFDAARVMREHERRGTCPNCHRTVATFCSLIIPDDQGGVQFGCAHCSPFMAAAINGAARARDWVNSRN